MATARSRQVWQRMEAHVLATHRPESRHSSTWLVAVIPLALTCVFIGSAFFAISRADPIDLSNVTLETVINGALEGAISVVGGHAFKTEDTVANPVQAHAQSAEPAPTAAPPIDLSTLAGSPYSGTAAVNAWRAAGITVDQQALAHDGFNALAGKAVGLSLHSGDNRVSIALIVYPDSGAVATDWQTSPGQQPHLKPDHQLPSFETIWWNRNLIVMVLDRGGSSSQAYDAFAGLN